MWRLVIACILAAGTVQAQAAMTGTARAAEGIAITHATVIDVGTGVEMRDRIVVVRDNRIVRVDTMAGNAPPSFETVIDGRGRYVIPGLWDMHAHTYGSLDLAPMLYIANGVTGIRDMGSRIPVERVLAVRDSIRSGTRLGPRMVVAGMISGPRAVGGDPDAVRTPEEAKRHVDSLARLGVDFIKVFETLSPLAFFAAADASRAHGLPLGAAHLPWSVSAAEASDAGLRAIEHLFGVLEGCSSVGDSVRAQIGHALMTRGDALPGWIEGASVDVLMQHFDATLCDALFARFARNGTAQDPTMSFLRQYAWPDSFTRADDPRSAYVPPAELERWRAARRGPPARMNWSGGEWPWTTAHPEMQRHYAAMEELVRRLARSGVTILAGSDAGYPYTYHGASLHDELVLLVRAGLTPLEALQAATLNLARYLRSTDSLGTVAAGKVADLVLLDGDPLADIHNTQKVFGVIASGCYLDRAALDALLRLAKRIANSSSTDHDVPRSLPSQRSQRGSSGVKRPDTSPDGA